MKFFTKTYWDKNPTLFRAVFILIASFFLLVSFWNFVSTTTMPTDENLFQDPVSKFYVLKDTKAFIIKNGKKLADSIHKGDLILKINEIAVDSANQAADLIFSLPDSATIKLEVACMHRKEIRNIYAKREDLGNKFFAKLKSAVLVVGIAEDGASDRAGLKVGDLITKINGKTFKTAIEADMIMRNLEANSEIVYEILRDAHIYKISIRLAKFGITFSYLLSFLSGLLFIATGLFFGLARPNFFAARIIALALLFVGFSITGRMNPSFSLYLYSSQFVMALTVITNLAFLSGVSLFIHSTLYFPVERSELSGRQNWIYIPYAIAIITTATTAYMIISKQVSPGFSSYLSLLTILGFIAVAVFASIKLRGSVSKNNRKIGRAIIFSLSLNLIALFITQLMRIFNYSSPLFGYTGLLIILIPISYIYTVARYRLLDLDLRLRKNNQYLLVTFSWRALLFFALFAFLWAASHIYLELPNIHFTGTSIEVLQKPLKEEYLSFYNTSISIILTLAFAYLLLNLYRIGIRYINKKYYRTSFDYRKASIDLSRVIESDITVDNFIETISNKIKSTIHINRVGIILFGDNGDLINYRFSELQNQNFADSLKVNKERLYEVIKHIAGSFRVEYFDDEFKQLIASEGFSSVIPIKSKGKVVGAVFLGDKLSETPINNEDVIFVQSFTYQAMIAIENLRLYEDLAKRERMKHELELARKIQLSSLPNIKPNVSGLEIAAVSIPAFEVGGDFFDYLNVGESEITVVVGDVSGKGASAALYMSKVQGMLRTLADFRLSPKELLIRTNALLHKYIDKNSFISVVSANINLNENIIKVARGGHLPVFMYSAAEKRVIEIKPKGLILGVSSADFFSSNIEEETVPIASGDILLFATDGAIEARSGTDEFGTERLKALISHFKYLAPSDLLQHILLEVNRFCNSSVGDDLTLVIVKIA